MERKAFNLVSICMVHYQRLIKILMSHYMYRSFGILRNEGGCGNKDYVDIFL